LDLKALYKQIEAIGRELIKCPLRCEGVINSPNKGKIPRYLILENSNSKTLGCVIVGINPGSAKKYEEKAYINNCTYDQVLEIWRQRIKKATVLQRFQRVSQKTRFSRSNTMDRDL